MTTPKRYGCKHCPAAFVNKATLGGHMHANHPHVSRQVPKFLRETKPRPSHNRPAKLATDTWPGRA